MHQDADAPRPATSAGPPRPGPPATPAHLAGRAAAAGGPSGGAHGPAVHAAAAGGPVGGPVPVDGTTGDPGVDDALLGLDQLDGRPVHEHVRVFDAVQAALQGRLADED